MTMPFTTSFRPLTLVLATAVIGVGLAGCGESKEQKAMKAVCSARGEIQTSVNDLKSLTLTTASVNGVKDELNSIKNNVQKITDNEKNLSSDRKQQITQANQEFSQQLQSIASGLTSNLSLSNAASQVKTAGQKLQSAYTSALAPIDC
jgi:uncharacterized protein HemX